jgi:hypothetical protein
MTFEHTFRFIEWLGSRFGVAGQVGFVLLLIGTVIGILWLVQKLPAPKGQVLCGYCIHENPNKNSAVYCCPHYKLCRPFQVRAKDCPHAAMMNERNSV